jgi:hypothetical protein
MKRIEIHCVDANGEKSIMNHLSGENTEISGKPLKKEQLILRAQKMAYDWSIVYPHDKFTVVEV